MDEGELCYLVLSCLDDVAYVALGIELLNEVSCDIREPELSGVCIRGTRGDAVAAYLLALVKPLEVGDKVISCFKFAYFIASVSCLEELIVIYLLEVGVKHFGFYVFRLNAFVFFKECGDLVQYVCYNRDSGNNKAEKQYPENREVPFVLHCGACNVRAQSSLFFTHFLPLPYCSAFSGATTKNVGIFLGLVNALYLFTMPLRWNSSRVFISISSISQ